MGSQQPQPHSGRSGRPAPLPLRPPPESISPCPAAARGCLLVLLPAGRPALCSQGPATFTTGKGLTLPQATAAPSSLPAPRGLSEATLCCSGQRPRLTRPFFCLFIICVQITAPAWTPHGSLRGWCRLQRFIAGSAEGEQVTLRLPQAWPEASTGTGQPVGEWAVLVSHLGGPRRLSGAGGKWTPCCGSRAGWCSRRCWAARLQGLPFCSGDIDA